MDGRGRKAQGMESFEGQMSRMKFALFLLWLTSKREMHGYEIIKTLRSDKAIPAVAVSKIYPLLFALSAKGLISQHMVMQGRRARKAYRLTPKGRQALAKAKKYIRSSRLMMQFMREMVS